MEGAALDLFVVVVVEAMLAAKVLVLVIKDMTALYLQPVHLVLVVV